MATDHVQLAPFDIKKQIHHYRFVLTSLKNETFYIQNRFYYLPHLYESARSRIIFLPKLKDIETSRRILNIPLNQDLPTELEQQIKELIQEVYAKRKSIYSNLYNEILSKLKDINKILSSEFQEQELSKIELHIKLFGSSGSYHLPKDIISSYDASKILINPRYDSTWEKALYLAIIALVHKNHFPLGIQSRYEAWKEKQDQAHKIFEKYIPKDKPLTDILSKTTISTLAKESKQYLNELGREVKDINIKELEKSLTKKEYKALQLIHNAESSTVTFVDIYKEIWPEKNSSDYSQYAVTKLVERIRSKLYEVGISPQFIHTDRGSGYSWY